MLGDAAMAAFATATATLTHGKITGSQTVTRAMAAARGEGTAETQEMLKPVADAPPILADEALHPTSALALLATAKERTLDAARILAQGKGFISGRSAMRTAFPYHDWPTCGRPRS